MASQASGLILRGPSGKPLDLDNLARRVPIPALAGDGCEGSKIERHGWYSFRRGIATLTTSVANDPLAANGLLRHENVATTMNHYIKDVPEATERAMQLVEQLCSVGVQSASQAAAGSNLFS